MNSIKYEVLTLVTATETYRGGNSKKAKIGREVATALDHVLPLLDKLGVECQVIASSTKDYKLVPVSRKRKQ